jgi:murein DD-endopeptidase MepM/ murein hydrolase activator NlpD
MAYDDVDLSYPLGVAGVITQTFDEHTWGNKGTDFAVVGGGEGTQLIMASDGEVVKLGYDEAGYGNYVKLRIHPHYEILYAHMLRPTPLKLGDKVVRGRVVGLMGSTGRSTGAHLHFELRRDGKCIKQTIRTLTDTEMPSWCGLRARA